MDKLLSTLDFLGVTMELVQFQAHGSRALNLHLKKRLHPGWRRSSKPWGNSSLEILPNSNSNQKNSNEAKLFVPRSSKIEHFWFCFPPKSSGHPIPCNQQNISILGRVIYIYIYIIPKPDLGGCFFGGVIPWS